MKKLECPECGKMFQSLGYASHRAMHRREREKNERKKNWNQFPAQMLSSRVFGFDDNKNEVTNDNRV